MKRYFSAPLADLGSTDLKYAGVLCPEPELNLPKIGVTETLLSGAEDYFKKFENFSYIFGLLKGELDALGVEPRGIAIDFGSGFGNTVIPLLENYRDLVDRRDRYQPRPARHPIARGQKARDR